MTAVHMSLTKALDMLMDMTDEQLHAIEYVSEYYGEMKGAGVVKGLRVARSKLAEKKVGAGVDAEVVVSGA